MKAVDSNTQRMMVHYERQLHKLGFRDTAGMNYGELKQQLTKERIKQFEKINHDSPDNVWF